MDLEQQFAEIVKDLRLDGSEPFAEHLVREVFGREPTEDEKQALYQHLILGMMASSVALKFATETETWPVFMAWCAKSPGGKMPLDHEEARRGMIAFGTYVNFLIEQRRALG